MHDTAIGPVGVFLGQDTGHVIVGGARVNDQRQARLACGIDVGTQRRFLNLGAVRGVIIIQPGFADADKFGMGRKGNQFVSAHQRFLCCTHRVGANRIENRFVGLCDGADVWFIAQFGADRDHAGNASLNRALNKRATILIEIWEIQMAMAVSDLWFLCHRAPEPGLSRGGVLDLKNRI